ncbi:MAG: PspA/IM30 family protein [Armatimonadetes bacterium]|nr:PspA/IM30 family protein [Armatimonadota bacterium]
MSLFRDIQTAIREGLDDLLNAGVTRDEVDEVTGLLDHDLNEARAELELARADEKRIQARIDEQRREAEVLQKRAEEAVGRNDDEAGRELIRRRRRALRGVELLEKQWSEHQSLIAELQDHIEELEDKLHELRLRGDFLRTRGRVAELRSRFERYRRDYGLDDVTGEDDVLAEEIAPEELEAEATRTPRSRRLEPEPEERERAAEPRAAHGEAPRPAPEEPPAPLRRRRHVEEEEDEPVWEQPPRDLALERERMLRDIERRQRNEEFESSLDAELQRMKKAQAGVPAAPPEEPPAADKPAGGEAPDAAPPTP